MSYRIAILFHENDRYIDLRYYAIAFLADIWREKGDEVIFVFGTNTFVPADIAILHVNLSVVPEEYIDFAGRYPIVLNREVRDIRKSCFSRNLLGPGDDYEGEVIVKTDLNSAGGPERYLSRSRVAQLSLKRIPPRVRAFVSRRLRTGSDGAASMRNSTDYRIYGSLGEVPKECFDDPGLVVEKFLPEREDGLFYVRYYHFLGDKGVCIRVAAEHPIVKFSNMDNIETVAVHQEIEDMRRKMNFDYGKFDYVVRDDEPVLIDVNKTTGSGDSMNLDELRRARAGGIYSYLE